MTDFYIITAAQISSRIESLSDITFIFMIQPQKFSYKISYDIPLCNNSIFRELNGHLCIYCNVKGNRLKDRNQT